MKTPFAAYLIRAPLANGFTDSLTVRACTVLSIERDMAEILLREGTRLVRRQHHVSELASTPDRLLKALRDPAFMLLRKAPNSLAVAPEDAALLALGG